MQPGEQGLSRHHQNIVNIQTFGIYGELGQGDGNNEIHNVEEVIEISEKTPVTAIGSQMGVHRLTHQTFL